MRYIALYMPASVLWEHISTMHHRWGGLCDAHVAVHALEGTDHYFSFSSQSTGIPWFNGCLVIKAKVLHNLRAVKGVSSSPSANVNKSKSRELWCHQTLTMETVTAQWDHSLCAIPFWNSHFPLDFAEWYWVKLIFGFLSWVAFRRP